MTKEVLKVDPLTGDVTTFEYDTQTDKAVVNVKADVGEQIDDNKRWKNASEFKREIPGLGQRIAHIPPSVGMLWLYEYGVDVWSSDPDQRRAVMVMLNSPEWSFLRTNDWNLGTRQKKIFHSRAKANGGAND